MPQPHLESAAKPGRGRERWGSGFGFVLAAAGSAVGLGNLWGFAYRASQGGGGAFVLLYLLIVLAVCLPVLIAEMVLGRSTRHSPLLAPITAGGARWAWLGWLFQLAACGILAFYAVLMGWTGRTLLHALLSGLPRSIEEAEGFFEAISGGGGALLGQLLSLVLTALVVAGGVRRGIERLSRWVMPLLFLLLLVLAGWAATLPDATAGYREFLLSWDAAKLLDPSTIRNAFSQAFFSIGTGIGCILAYAAYLDQRSPLPREAVAVVAMDTLVGLMAGLVTFPVVMSFGLAKLVSASTVGTLFIALPTGMASLGDGGRWVAVAFFSLAYMAAITSSVSLLEVPVASLMDRLGWTRPRAVWLSSAAIFVAGVPSALNISVLGRMDAVFGGVMLIAGGLALAVLLGWIDPQRFEADLEGSGSPAGLRRWLLRVLRWLSPPCIALGLIFSLLDLVRDWS
ncbi:sodium-dependent transporter [Synechococcus sp. RSCCF101]|uniref:sodium-dependent transporter n=1 Tax=Synechococcus sp. RSCCF101 TaxID=2511069 RepID=UPI00124457FE|nr:sodium-dependent transporter [Synechococcus sp. RSCCF101]QEY32013.1 sodium-dependent transporter [Synechococcus sp. RSCCF101]